MKSWKESKLTVLLLITGAVYFFLKAIVPLTAPVLIAVVFVTIFGPFLLNLQRRFRIHRQIGAIILLCLATVILGTLIGILLSWILGSKLEWTSMLGTLERNISEQIHIICLAGNRYLHLDSGELEQTLLDGLKGGVNWFSDRMLSGVLSHSLDYLMEFLAAGAFLACFLIATVLLAKDYDKVMNSMLEREEWHPLLEVLCGIIRYIASFVKAQLIIMTTIGALSAVVLGLTNVECGVMWGLITGILDALPFIGAGIVLVPLTIQLIMYGSYGKAAICAALYIVCVLVRQFLEPKLIGKKVGVPPIAILLSIYAGVKLFGGWGLVGGPLGFVIIYQTYQSYEKRMEKV